METQKYSLQVYHDLEKVGTLTAYPLQEGGYLLTFAYTSTWTRFPLSPHLPFGEISKGAPVWNFFLNLLPEGHVLEDVAYRMNLRIHDVFGFLRHFGRDCAGAITLLPLEATPNVENAYSPIDVQRLRRHLPDGPRDPKQRESGPLFMFGGKPRMSLAGAQDKLGVLLAEEGKLYLPEGESPSTHVLKSSCSSQFPFCVLNEYLMMKLATGIGLPVPQVQMLRLPEPLYIVRRFDRLKSGQRYRRLHQIDMCQFFNVPNIMKYEEGSYQYAPKGLTLKNCFEFARCTTNPQDAVKNVLKWTCFNYLIGNTDAHGKNIAALVDEKGLHLAPFYDMLSVFAYGDDYSNMAFSIGGEDNLFLIDKECWVQMARECDIEYSKLRAELQFQSKHLLLSLSDILSHENVYPEEQKFVEKIQLIINEQCLRVRHLIDETEEEDMRPGF